MRKTRAALFASVSIVALAATSSSVMAADLPAKAPKITPAAAPQNLWTWWVEGGAIDTADPYFGLSAPLTGVRPNWGWEAAIGFDRRVGPMSPYHWSGQFRYGAAKRSTISFSRYETFIGGTPTARTTPVTGVGNGTGDVKEFHWLVDFSVGQDFGLGGGVTQAKVGIRVAELSSKLSANEAFIGSFSGATSVHGNISYYQRSRFLGIGPRIGIDGSVPLGGSWTFDYLGDAAVLFGQRKFDSTITPALLYDGTTTPVVVLSGLPNMSSTSSTVAVFNLDAQAGISYWFTPNYKLTASYRFDGYWNALREYDVNGNVVNVDRFFHGPMLRFTATLP
jgi:hypothetical protein